MTTTTTEPVVRCLDCAKFSVQRAPDWRQRDGFGCCEGRQDWLVFHAERERFCDRFAMATPDVVSKRREWILRTKGAAR